MKYRYTGQIALATTIVIDNKHVEVLAQVGAVIELPANHGYTQTLLARGLLKPTIETPVHKKGSK